MSERPILIVGSPRSGTTLLRDLLRSHPRLTFPPESNLLPSLFRLHGDPASERRARLLARDLLGTFSVGQWQLGLRPQDLVPQRSFAAMTAELYRAWAAREGKARWGDKTPLYALELPTVLRIFPGAQVVHVIRDGRDVVGSLLRQPWGPTRALSAARLWRRCVRAAMRDGSSLPPDSYLEVSFERLVAAPETALRTLCAFLGERFEPALLTPSRIGAPPGLAQPWQPAQEAEIDASVVGRWRQELSAADLAVVEHEAGELLRALGYDAAGTGRVPRLAERALCRASDGLGLLRWRATTWDRLPRARTTVALARSRLLHALRLIGGRPLGGEATSP
jgi:hypothetical protein